MWQSLPELGTGALYAVLVVASYTFAVAVAAGRGRPRLLPSARLGAYATSGLVLFAILLLAYGFITHDFRLRYVARYSDRSMPTEYLFTALWGGQDGSLLWWSFLLSLYIAACVRWLKGRYRVLQPYIIATLMMVLGFFVILMLFAANPFHANVAGAPPDGEGLNVLLQNYWMAIHPPALYLGFVGCSVPFAFAIAALVTGRLKSEAKNEWIVAVRKWMLFAFLFLSIGNVLGMIWAYEELGWGGFWAWDPVENAACLPWFTAAAYVHSTMIQERRNTFKIWNVFLICLTFFLTLFGTFLTRSGMIASVHSFAQSDIGIFFVWGMGFTLATCAGLIVWRLPMLRSTARIESIASRDAMFVINNWALLGGMTFILVATLFPKLSEWIIGETVTVGPPFFNRWMAPIGLLIFAMMGMAPLFGWSKTSRSALERAFAVPLGVLAITAVLHVFFGPKLGYPAFVESDTLYPGVLGLALQKIESAWPLVTVSLAGFNLTVIFQEFYRGVAARRFSAARRNEPEGVLTALFRLVDKNRRRYGGYVVHLGIVCMFLGFVGPAWKIEVETSLAQGESYRLGPYELTYLGPRMCPGNPKCSPQEQSDISKRMLFADLEVTRNGNPVGRISPAKFIYHAQPEQPTSEVALVRGLREDLYTVLGTADPASKRATFQFHMNPFVGWIWIGLLVLISGATISLWPDLGLREVGVWSYMRTAAGTAAGAALAVWLAMGPSTAFAAVRPRPPLPYAVAGPAKGAERPGETLPGIGGAALLGLGVGGLAAALRGRRARWRKAAGDAL
ncbi:MAG TPA: cytochrome c-type biogenesis CcmF C-terminal domain-containing protein [Polyangiaceae bacterium]|jgi:cytochrome c-type biogenesis protein CcmF